MRKNEEIMTDFRIGGNEGRLEDRGNEENEDRMTHEAKMRKNEKIMSKNEEK
jgi:hypothetical protein